MENNIKVSIIMPVYNSGNYLRGAIDSILNQSFKKIELILVDDGSVDDTPSICDYYHSHDTRVIVIHQKNGGICNARNTALKIAKGEYIGFADHDDEYVEGYLEHAYKEAKLNDADLVKVGKKELIICNDKIIRTKFSNLPHRYFSKEDIVKEYFDLVDSDELDCVWDGLFRRSIIDKYNLYFDEKFKKGGEDVDFVQRYIRCVSKLVTIDKIYYLHYIRKGFSTSSKFSYDSIDAKGNIILQMSNTMNILGIDTSKNESKYTYLLLRQYIAPLCSVYSDKNSGLSICQTVNKIRDILNQPFVYPFCKSQNALEYIKFSKKYSLLYFLLKYRLYIIIIFMYRYRNK